jgi:hypothetical protein
MATKLAVQRLCEKYKKRRLKKDYAFKQALLSAEPKIIKAALDKQRIPHSDDDFAMMHIAKYLTSKIQDHPITVVQAALKKYDEYFRKDM